MNSDLSWCKILLNTEWSQYSFNLLLVSALSCLPTYIILQEPENSTLPSRYLIAVKTKDCSAFQHIAALSTHTIAYKPCRSVLACSVQEKAFHTFHFALYKHQTRSSLLHLKNLNPLRFSLVCKLAQSGFLLLIQHFLLYINVCTHMHLYTYTHTLLNVYAKMCSHTSFL